MIATTRIFIDTATVARAQTIMWNKDSTTAGGKYDHHENDRFNAADSKRYFSTVPLVFHSTCTV